LNDYLNGVLPRFAIIIPARYESNRYPGKPLAMLRGAAGIAKPLIQRSWDSACAVESASGVWVATDDLRIAEVASAFGGKVVMTSVACRNGTERCADALAGLEEVPEIVVNLQGDAPLTPASIIAELVDALAHDPDAAMATPALACSRSTYDHLIADQAAGRVGGTTVVMNAHGHALYFSKRVLPYLDKGPTAHEQVHLHLGVYAYRLSALKEYATRSPSPLELCEGLEQLRFLEAGKKVLAVRFPPLEWDCIELNNPEDAPAIEAVLAKRGII
jgi:3-deoxy-manno-octulosonate cytidylyltransferase (CMP-KDO synthetase)